ncbi:hypothetical protein EDEG_01199 [Edhazardia aedis USNM 41457]|uniref:Uncharacterized protein n=1 Tax=Edhazardia aedis (strain USNM 41457) TaxID=1003232 RepID=J9DPZ1_EDHAE|nr:hypothetical protein EDEG_01199 [Edhazardia aedis USNM 41457]|eukprot:EJW04615.1 hypothetical protein EDEG_01199 [Edhazardia aedis USNM 41457]
MVNDSATINKRTNRRTEETNFYHSIDSFTRPTISPNLENEGQTNSWIYNNFEICSIYAETGAISNVENIKRTKKTRKIKWHVIILILLILLASGVLCYYFLEELKLFISALAIFNTNKIIDKTGGKIQVHHHQQKILPEILIIQLKCFH